MNEMDDALFDGFTDTEKQDILDAVDLLKDRSTVTDKEVQEFFLEPWKLHYRVNPPTIEEFLTEEWIGPTANSLYPNVKKVLIEFWKPDSQKRHLVLGGATATGKSFTSTLSSLYVTVHLWCMKDPKKFFGLSQATSIVHALISFSMEKAGQLLLQPFMQILLSTPKFRRVKQEENLNKKQLEYPNEICWTSAGKMGALQFYNDIHYMLASSPQKLLGLNMISATMSELSFFLDQGFSADYIWRIYNDAKGRIKGRFGTAYFAGTIMDSSPNDMEDSPIDKYIFSGAAEKDPRNMVVTGSQWELVPFQAMFDTWRKTGETFPVFKGNSSEPPRLITEEERQNYVPDDIYEVPIDLKQNFEDNCLKMVKDSCGWPAGSSGKLFSSWDPIENMFTPVLNNIYSSIIASSDKPGERLIWNIVHKYFWIKLEKNKHEFYRAPTSLRYIHVDQAETGDMAGLTMSHVEAMPDGTLVYVIDFTIGITAGKGRINLEAIRFFLTDIIHLGKIKIAKVTFDQYQSSSTIQYLKEKGANAGRLSVDRDMAPYLAFITLMNTRHVKSGKNIFLKNNFKSLQEVSTPSGKKKIDHKKGKVVFDDGGDWDQSLMGINAKDLSDSAVGSVYNALMEFQGIPKMMWNPQQGLKKFSAKTFQEEVEEEFGVTF